MSNRRINGGIIGAVNDPIGGRASGIWSSYEQFVVKKKNLWPNPKLPLVALGTVGNPAASATALYTSTGGTVTDGVYYIQNIYTGNTEKQCYCRFNVDGLHYQRWSLMDLAGYNDNGNYGDTGTASEADNATIAADSSATSTGWYKETGSSTGSGGSTTYDTGLQLSGVAGHYWLLYSYQQSAGGGGWAQSGGLDWGASASGGNWGDTYQAEIYITQRGDIPTGNGRHILGRAVWGATSCTTSWVGSTTSYAAAWTLADNWATNSTAKSNITGITTSNYIGTRLHAWSDDGNNGRSYYAYWVYIP